MLNIVHDKSDNNSFVNFVLPDSQHQMAEMEESYSTHRGLADESGQEDVWNDLEIEKEKSQVRPYRYIYIYIYM